MESVEARRTIADLIVALEVANEDEFSHEWKVERTAEEWKAIAGAALLLPKSPLSRPRTATTSLKQSRSVDKARLYRIEGGSE